MTGPTSKRICPEVLWAQRKDKIILTINVRECPKDYSFNIQPKKITFCGKNEKTNTDYVLDLDLFGEVNNTDFKKKASDRSLQLSLNRKEEGEYWPRLLESKAKLHFLKTDFDRWIDEDETDDDDETANWEDMMGNMNIGGADFGSDDEEEPEDSDDDSLPDLEDDKPAKEDKIEQLE